MQRIRRGLSHPRYGMPALFGASFLETTVVPIPIEVVLIPFMVVNRDRVWWIATVALAGCLLGAFVGYGVGYFVFESIGRWLIEIAGWQSHFAAFQQQFRAHGFWAIVAVGVAPIPFQIAMLVAGATGYSIALFTLAALAARSLRYYGVAVLVVVFGEVALQLWRRHSRRASVIALVLVVALAVALHLLTPGA
ncbi:MAG: VTT domain-containing protein [Halofilum sp. (in: g-proteobacteria)]